MHNVQYVQWLYATASNLYALLNLSWSNLLVIHRNPWFNLVKAIDSLFLLLEKLLGPCARNHKEAKLYEALQQDASTGILVLIAVSMHWMQKLHSPGKHSEGFGISTPLHCF